MPGMNETYRNAIGNHGASLISHIGLVDELGAEITGGDPAYARQEVTWASASEGEIRPDDDLTFDIPSGVTVGGWRGYGTLTGGTTYGGKAVEEEEFTGQGQYILKADQTSIQHNSA